MRLISSREANVLDGVEVWAGYYRANPQRFAKDYLNVNLRLFQKILLFMMNISNFFCYIAARGQGKSWLLAVFCCVRCILYPGTKVCIASGTRGKLHYLTRVLSGVRFDKLNNVLEKIKMELMPMSPLLRNEIGTILISTTAATVEFKNGSSIKVVTASDSARSNRANILLVDEFRMVSKDTIDTVLRRFLTAPRMPGYLHKKEYAHLKERNKEIYLSSAYFKSHWSYEKVKDYARNMLDSTKRYFVCGLPYQLSIAENIFAGRLSKGLKRVNWKEINRKAKELLDRIGFDADPRTEVGSLTVAGKQMVEIAKALSRDCRIILMDEPSATLTKKELNALFDIIRDLKKRGIAVIYISHRMEEIFEICETATVMRDGRIIGTVNVGEVSPDRIVEMMVGREVSSAYPKRDTVPGEEILRVENLCRKDRRQNVSFSLRKGEVLGIAGLVGAGRTEIMRGLFGVDYITSCDVYVHGQKVRIPTPAAAKKHGIAFLTEDRKIEGLTLDFTIKANMSMANLPKLRRGLLTSAKVENEIADQYIKLINVKTPSRNQKVGNLSGGNQQKVVIGKWLNADPEILIMDEPTRGIDVGAKWEIYGIINELAAQGKAVILISSELPEVLGMSDRVLVVKDDAIVAELTGDEINAVEVMRYAL